MRTRSFMALTGAFGLTAMTLAAMTLTGCSPGTLSAQSAHAAVGVDWPAVERTLDTPLAADRDGVYNASLPRDDLHVTADGVQLRPGMGIGTEVHFLPTDNGRALLAGALTVTDAEQDKVIDDLQRGGLEITAIYQELPTETPALWSVRFTGYGTASAEAAAVHSALSDTGTPSRPDPSGDAPLAGLDVAALDRALGLPHTTQGGAYQYHLPAVMPSIDMRARRRLPPAIGTSTLLMFQPLGNNQAAAGGDFVLTAPQIAPVITALRAGGIRIVGVHNHMLDETPRLFYLHYWANGDALTIAATLRDALHKIRAV